MEKTKKPANPALIAAVKAVAVLVIICLVCVILLALCNDLLYVSDEEKLAHSMSKIYPDYGEGDKEFNETFKLDSSNATNSYGSVVDVKKAADGAYVLTAKGGGGYKGTVTVYLVVKEEGEGSSKDAKIKAWTIKESDGETLLANITNTHRSTWYVGKSITEYTSESFSVDNNKVSNTTMSSKAINNAVKAACEYCISVLELVTTPESEAIKAVSALAEGYTFTIVTDSDGYEAYTVGENKLSFYLEGTKADADTLEAYVYGTDENRQIVIVKSGLTHDELLAAEPVAKSENATAEVVDKVKSLSHFEYVIGKMHEGFQYTGTAELDAGLASDSKYGTVNKVYNGADGAVVIEATGNGGFESGTVTINVVIGTDGKVEGWYILSSEKQSFIDNITSAWDTVSSWYVGTEASEAEIALGDNKVNGTTYSSTAINHAMNMACHYYVKCIAAAA